MGPEDVINLFDSCWFNYEIFKKNQSFSFNYHSKTNPSEPKFSSLRSILVRSQSEDMASFSYGSFSPNSVLFTPLLKSIPSGKPDCTKQEHQQEEGQEQEAVEQTDNKEQSILPERKKNKKRRIGMSKSLSDLEFEELKGFMDLGFVFSEEDKHSRLVEIIPGLQRFGHERESGYERESVSNSSSSTAARRPYLSEAWEDFDRKPEKREHTPPLMMDWEVPAHSDDIDMKDNLKLWAHTVATFLR